MASLQRQNGHAVMVRTNPAVWVPFRNLTVFGADLPERPPGLPRTLPAVIATPHFGLAPRDELDRPFAEVYDQPDAVVAGAPVYLVCPAQAG